jgi:hypothetical protein
MSATDLARGSGRWIRVGLLVLAVVPVAAGATRLPELALAAAAGTQVLFAERVFGDVERSGGVVLGAGRAINLAVVEHVIGRRRVAPASAMVVS